jgi:hypothetical protein
MTSAVDSREARTICNILGSETGSAEIDSSLVTVLPKAKALAAIAETTSLIYEKIKTEEGRCEFAVGYNKIWNLHNIAFTLHRIREGCVISRALYSFVSKIKEIVERQIFFSPKEPPFQESLSGATTAGSVLSQIEEKFTAIDTTQELVLPRMVDFAQCAVFCSKKDCGDALQRLSVVRIIENDVEKLCPEMGEIKETIASVVKCAKNKLEKIITDDFLAKVQNLVTCRYEDGYKLEDIESKAQQLCPDMGTESFEHLDKRQKLCPDMDTEMIGLCKKRAKDWLLKESDGYRFDHVVAVAKGMGFNISFSPCGYDDNRHDFGHRIRDLLRQGLPTKILQERLLYVCDVCFEMSLTNVVDKQIYFLETLRSILRIGERQYESIALDFFQHSTEIKQGGTPKAIYIENIQLTIKEVLLALDSTGIGEELLQAIIIYVSQNYDTSDNKSLFDFAYSLFLEKGATRHLCSVLVKLPPTNPWVIMYDLKCAMHYLEKHCCIKREHVQRCQEFLGESFETAIFSRLRKYREDIFRRIFVLSIKCDDSHRLAKHELTSEEIGAGECSEESEKYIKDQGLERFRFINTELIDEFYGYYTPIDIWRNILAFLNSELKGFTVSVESPPPLDSEGPKSEDISEKGESSFSEMLSAWLGNHNKTIGDIWDEDRRCVKGPEVVWMLKTMGVITEK